MRKLQTNQGGLTGFFQLSQSLYQRSFGGTDVILELLQFTFDVSLPTEPLQRCLGLVQVTLIDVMVGRVRYQWE